uniref:Uncharacterized protein n=1 Tax=Rhizophora mucronata TaxID=61149 RepID=A0A2P2P2A2_RHIMU
MWMGYNKFYSFLFINMTMSHHIHALKNYPTYTFGWQRIPNEDK